MACTSSYLSANVRTPSHGRRAHALRSARARSSSRHIQWQQRDSAFARTGWRRRGVLTNSNPAGGPVPASVTVPAGTTSVSFSISSAAAGTSRTTTISATYASSTANAILTVSPVTLTRMSMSAANVTGGNQLIGNEIDLTAGAPAGTSVSLSSSAPSVASVPASITVPVNSNYVNFTVTTTSVSTSTPSDHHGDRRSHACVGRHHGSAGHHQHGRPSCLRSGGSPAPGR